MNEFKKLVNFANSYELAGKSYGAEQWLSILFSRFASLKYKDKWIKAGTFEGTDLRPMTLSRIVNATIWYEQNILASLKLHDQYAQDIVNHSFSEEFAIDHSAIWREVMNRSGYLDSVYFAIDYFISQMIKIHGVALSRQNKASNFLSLLRHFSMETAGSTKQEIVSEIRLHLPTSMGTSRSALVEQSDSMVPFQKSFEYLTLIRNSLHNNGFANKTMNDLVIGPFEYKGIVKNQSLQCMGIPNLVVLILQMVNCIEQLCERSVAEITAPQNDPHLEFMKSRLGFYP
ncbi:hypothetical protein [Nitrosomonas sp. H1_AOB3]|uniref:hypothetical protein n=1 Tax=Nitrosomonas sp. H1_AOB3 TaxID=2741553 RepID=UPI001937341C|nr:hypothetical protein [Nitrosomonas sp. H1_AOB3]QOJ08655.1 MAG: hypothetical protein HRU73_03665 [Nitrosomonas sp. H1_AOB3]